MHGDSLTVDCFHSLLTSFCSNNFYTEMSCFAPLTNGRCLLYISVKSWRNIKFVLTTLLLLKLLQFSHAVFLLCQNIRNMNESFAELEDFILSAEVDIIIIGTLHRQMLICSCNYLNTLSFGYRYLPWLKQLKRGKKRKMNAVSCFRNLVFYQLPMYSSHTSQNS